MKFSLPKTNDRSTSACVLLLHVQTDTASVLHETIEYIKFLHEQVGVSAIDLAAAALWSFKGFNHKYVEILIYQLAFYSKLNGRFCIYAVSQCSLPKEQAASAPSQGTATVVFSVLLYTLQGSSQIDSC